MVPPFDEDYEQARSLVLRWGWNSTCYQVLNPGITRWLDPEGVGLVGYVPYAGVAVVAGAPVCNPDALPDIVDRWTEYARTQGLRVLYFAAEGRLREYFRSYTRAHSLSLGCQPEWNPVRFNDLLNEVPSQRAQVRRALNKGIEIREWDPSMAHQSPKLARVLNEWLRTRGLPTLHFLVEPETLNDTRDRRFFVASIGDNVCAFVTLCPIPARNGWLTEQFVRGYDAPNGTIEALLQAAGRAIERDGATYVTMGIVPLSVRAALSEPEPDWLRPVRAWATAHGNRFYNFLGLDAFKAKFRPEHWEPVVCIRPDGPFTPSDLYAIAGAFTGPTPISAFARGLRRAAVTELRRFSLLPPLP